MKNELIIATYRNLPRARSAQRLQEVMATVGLEEMARRFFVTPIETAEIEAT